MSIIKYIQVKGEKLYSKTVIVFIELFVAAYGKIVKIDFSRVESLEKLNIKNKEFEDYETSYFIHDKRLKKILSSYGVTKNDSLLDIGCGKGKMLFFFSKNFPFKRIDGVEVSKNLCLVAEKNLKKLKINKSIVYNMDARSFDELGKYNFFYFFNPFGCEIMKTVIGNIERSLKEKDRGITIIYLYPVCHKEIVNSGVFSLIDNFRLLGNNEVSIYRNSSTNIQNPL